MSIYEALANVMRDIKGVGKSGRNTQGNYSFRGIDAVVNAVGPALRKHGVIVVPEVTDCVYGTVTVGKNKTEMSHARLTVAFTFYGPDGDSIRSVTVAEAMDSGDKAVSKAHSVAFRTALIQTLCLPTDETDPDAKSYSRSSADPLTEAKGLVWSRAKAKGWNQQELSDDYAQWTQGAKLTEASADDLRSYAATLEPTTTVQRQS